MAELTKDTIPIVDQKEQEEFEKIAIRSLVRRLDWRLIPFMFPLEATSYMNRVSIGRYLLLESSIIDNTLLGYVKLMGIESDLNLSPSESDWGISIFFLAYVRKLSH